jgi:quercetin dioxygenase-like cupin family protein
VIRTGDEVFFEPGEDHWHGAAPNRPAPRRCSGWPQSGAGLRL